MNYRFHTLRIFGSGSVLYYIFYSYPYQNTARNKVRQVHFNFLKNAYESYSQLARQSLRHSFKTYHPPNLCKPDRVFRFFPSNSFHIQRILCDGRRNNVNSDSKKSLQGEENGSSTKSPDSSCSKETGEQLEKLSLVKRFKLMYKQYWYVLIPVHMATSAVWFGSFFFAAKSGIDIVPLLEHFGVSENYLCYFRSSNAGYYGIAYAMYKLATPARYTVTLGGTTLSINYLVVRGYIKPVPTKEELKEMYEDKKEEMKERTDEMREKYLEKKEVFLEKYHDKTEGMREKYEEKKNVLLEKYKIKSNKDDEKKR